MGFDFDFLNLKFSDLISTISKIEYFHPYLYGVDLTFLISLVPEFCGRFNSVLDKKK